jgi:YidC/Oxa1 family membrane protein insertase
MSLLISIYTEVLWRPLFNGLILFYTILPWQDIGLAIILLTIVIRAALTPILWKAQKAQRDLARIQPEIKKIQEQFKQDREQQGKALMELYAHHKVNPFSGCLLFLFQIPIFIALLHVFQNGFDASQLDYLYSFISRPDTINPESFGILDLSQGDIRIGIIAAITQFIQTKLTIVKQPPSEQHPFARALQTQSLYLFPALILFWSYSFPSALTLYWTVMSIFGIVQELVARRIARNKVTISDQRSIKGNK